MLSVKTGYGINPPYIDTYPRTLYVASTFLCR